MGGVAMAALCLALAIGLIIVVKHELAAPVTSKAAKPTGTSASSAPKSASESLAEARRAMEANDYPRAGAILGRAIEAYPVDQELRVELATALVAQKKPAEAYQQYEKALAIGPRSPKLHFMAGTVAAEAALLDRAEEQYSMAQTADMADPQIPLFLAMVQIKLDKTQAAVVSLLRVVKLRPEQAEAWGTLAEVYLKDAKPTIALNNIQEARRLQPEFSRWRIDEARILTSLNEPEKAATLLLALDPAIRRRPEVMKTLGECYGMLGKPADAAAMYADAATRDDGRADPEINYQAALWYERAKDAATAAKYAKIAAMLGNEDAREMADRLAKP